MIVAKLETTRDGELQLQDNSFKFCSVKEGLKDVTASDLQVGGLHLFHSSTAQSPTFAALHAAALPTAIPLPVAATSWTSASSQASLQPALCSLQDGTRMLAKAKAPDAVPVALPDASQSATETARKSEGSDFGAELAELADVEAGYGFGDDEDESVQQADKLMTELGDIEINKRNSSAIAGMGVGPEIQGGQAASGSSGIMRALERAKDVLRASNSEGSDVSVALTGSELEEEALLLLLRSQQEQRSPSETSASGTNCTGSEADRGPSVAEHWDEGGLEEASSDDDEAGGRVASAASSAASSAATGSSAQAGATCSDRSTCSRAQSARSRWAASMAETVAALRDVKTRGSMELGQNEELSLLARKPLRWQTMAGQRVLASWIL